MKDDLQISCPECYVPNQVASATKMDSTKVSLIKPGSGAFHEKMVECSNCNEKYTVYFSELRD